MKDLKTVTVLICITYLLLFFLLASPQFYVLIMLKNACLMTIVQARRTLVPVRATYVTPVPIGPLFRVFTFYFGWHILASLNHKIVDTFCKFF